MQTDITLYCGAILHALSPQKCQYIPNGGLVVRSTTVLFAGEREEALRLYPFAVVVDYSSAILLPGFIDTHVHLPQWPIIGLGGGELLEWLQTRVFPSEAQYANPDIARLRSAQFFRDALACGTTAMAVYCSPFYTATHEAFRAAAESGIRAVMGRTLMDTGAPPVLLASAEQNIAESIQLANNWHLYDEGRLRYAVTPRFALSCTPDLLRRCGEFARAEHLVIQTHLSENLFELAAVAQAFPEHASYTEVYDHFGLLTHRSVFAHCIHLTAHEQQALRDNNCAVSHCPTSNRFLQSGVMALRRYMNAGTTIALGTDVGAGYSLSVLHEAKEAIETSKSWNIIHRSEPEAALTPEEALWLATLAGAEVLDMGSTAGNFLPGKEADFIAVEKPYYSADTDTPGEAIARLMYSSPRILATYVRGKKLYQFGQPTATF